MITVAFYHLGSDGSGRPKVAHLGNRELAAIPAVGWHVTLPYDDGLYDGQVVSVDLTLAEAGGRRVEVYSVFLDAIVGRKWRPGEK